MGGTSMTTYDRFAVWCARVAWTLLIAGLTLVALAYITHAQVPPSPPMYARLTWSEMPIDPPPMWYGVERSDDGGGWREVMRVGVHVGQTLDVALSVGTTYAYRVVAHREDDTPIGTVPVT